MFVSEEDKCSVGASGHRLRILKLILRDSNPFSSSVFHHTHSGTTSLRASVGALVLVKAWH